LAKAIQARILEANQRTITLLDGDEVRKNLSSELGFSKADRDLNIQRLGYVAAEITKHKGIAIIAAIAPYAGMRDQIKSRISQYGGYIEIHVSTPLDVCQERDIKGLYARAKQGLITGVTGVDDPYETPEKPDMVLDTSQVSVEQGVEIILSTIESMGFAWR
jgi:sulfate adenylyltransferase